MKSDILSRIMGITSRRDVSPATPSLNVVDCEAVAPSEKAEKTLASPQEDIPSSDDEAPSEAAAEGVKKVEAIAIVWSKKELYIAYAW